MTQTRISSLDTTQNQSNNTDVSSHNRTTVPTSSSVNQSSSIEGEHGSEWRNMTLALEEIGGSGAMAGSGSAEGGLETMEQVLARRAASAALMEHLLALPTSRHQVRPDLAGQGAMEHLLALPTSRHQVRPDLPGQGAKVHLWLSVRSVLAVDDARQTVRLSAWVSSQWNDSSLAWDPGAHAGVTTLLLPDRATWKPAVNVVNAVPVTDLFAPQTYLNVTSDGLVFSSGALHLETQCKMDLTAYPYDTQRCPIVMMAFDQNIHLQVHCRKGDDLPGSAEVGSGAEWTLLDLSVNHEFDPVNSMGDLYFHFIWVRLQRKTAFYTACLVLPLAVTSYINCLVFLLPVQSGERASFVVTLFVSTSFFFGFMTEMMPRGLEAEHAPQLLRLLVGVVAQTLLVLVVTVVTVAMMRRQARRDQEQASGRQATSMAAADLGTETDKAVQGNGHQDLPVTTADGQAKTPKLSIKSAKIVSYIDWILFSIMLVGNMAFHFYLFMVPRL